MSLQVLRQRIESTLHRPVGALAMMALMLVLFVSTGARIQVHAHALDDGHHPELVVDGHSHFAAGHLHAEDHAEPSDNSGKHHVHVATIAATDAPRVASFLAVMWVPVRVVAPEPESRFPASRPAEHFRPPIA